VLIIAVLYLSHLNTDRPVIVDHRFIDGFRLGAVIYLGTFIEGNSFNYRLVFLLFCIPQLMTWMNSQARNRIWSRITFITLISSCWGMLLLRVLPVDLAFWLDELTNWILFTGLLYLFFISLPDWLIKEIDRFFNRYHFLSRKITTEPITNSAE
jgi:hypothetical protein